MLILCSGIVILVSKKLKINIRRTKMIHETEKFNCKCGLKNSIEKVIKLSR